MPSDGHADAVVHGDAFDALAELEEKAGQAAVVDYPWQFNAQNGTGRFGSKGDRGFDAYETEDHDRLAVVLNELARSLVDGAWAFVFADDDTYPEFRVIVEQSDLTYRRTLAWDRERFGMGCYHRVQHYPIILASNGETDRYVRGRGTVFRALKHDGTRSTDDYPTGKPVELYRQLLAEPVLEEGERLLEPLCGSAPGAAVAPERGLRTGVSSRTQMPSTKRETGSARSASVSVRWRCESPSDGLESDYSDLECEGCSNFDPANLKLDKPSVK